MLYFKISLYKYVTDTINMISIVFSYYPHFPNCGVHTT